ncbi:hypothetical protein H8B06_00885 [Sphingobacterium sp. DN00404]|uniref:Uncharacterized protein n=1 Tax=Sphingobacterium micropteri TaxID=2763501 RepID=A0ABR7YJ64_9SPHI|nr:hypothetical protein [Sphingobacterium micropteri]MBD1431365.1 hypothetical protein [Sphingobacterium micropteri]
MKHTTIYKWMLLFFIGVSISSCSKEDDNDGQSLIEQYGLAGTYTAQIIPSFMGSNPMASGEHTVYFEALGDGRLRMLYEKFRADPMPFEMTVDINMSVKQGPNNSILLEGTGGTFKALPPKGEETDPEDIPDGIQLPPGSEGGVSSDQASITGTYAEIEKDGQKALRYDLNLTPGVPLPIEILIYTKN